MSDGGVVSSITRERSLNRKSSKSRLEKQHEVEDEDPPKSQQKTEQQCTCEDDATEAAGTEEQQSKIQIPETRVESFDNVESDDDEKSVTVKSKVLVRSHAMCGDDDTKLNARAIEKQGSSKSSVGSSLSKESSNELYTDSTGINLEEFIISTLHKNPRDRTFLLDLHRTLVKFIEDAGQIHRFPPMSSYNRMLVHRVAAFFGLDHNVDQSGQAVVVSKMESTRIPETHFENYIKNDQFTDEPKQQRMLFKRDAQSYEEVQSRTPDEGLDIRKARSFEEREEETVRGRPRMFNQQDSSSSVEGIMESPVRPWSSTDSSSDQSQISILQRTQLMQKACSFGGVPVYYRNETSKISPRRSNTESTRESAGFYRQPTIPEGSSGPNSPHSIAAGQPVIFAVANIEQVPPGALIINPQTGQPYLNADGSVYRHVFMPRPMSAAIASPCAYAGAPQALLPFTPSSVSGDPQVAGLVNQLQQTNFVPVAGVNVSPDMAARTAMPSSQIYYGAPQVYTYMAQHQQQSTSESSPLHMPPPPVPPLPPQPSSQAILSPSPAPGYMQPLSVQYQEPLQPYQLPSGHIAYTQAASSSSTQVTMALSSGPIGYPVYYPPSAVASPKQHCMMPSVPLVIGAYGPAQQRPCDVFEPTATMMRPPEEVLATMQHTLVTSSASTGSYGAGEKDSASSALASSPSTCKH